MSTNHRLSLGVLATAAIALLIWRVSGSPSSDGARDPVATRTASVILAANNRVAPPPLPDREEAAPTVVQANAGPPNVDIPPAPESAPRPEGVLRGRLFAQVVGGDPDVPLAGYAILVSPVGTKDRRRILERHRATTREDGTFDVVGLADTEEWDTGEWDTGEWDIFAAPFDPTASPTGTGAAEQIGTAAAQAADSRERPTYVIAVGPVVTLRSALPAGLDPNDVLFEVRGEISLFSSHRGGDGGYALGRTTEEGFLRAVMPLVTNSVQNPRCGARATTRDGLFGAAIAAEGTLKNDRHFEIEAPMSPRGRIRIQVEFSTLEDVAPLEDVYIRWSLPLGDPEREELDLPPNLRTDWRARKRIWLGDSTFEVGDLPIGAVDLPAGPAFEGAAFEVVHAKALTAVHGTPETVVVQVRRTP